METVEDVVHALSAALEPLSQVEFAVLFGSAAQGRLRGDSDLDVAVYCASEGRLEIEALVDVSEEADIQIALERATGRNVDLLILNRGPATVCASALVNGVCVLKRNAPLYTRYFLAVTHAAMDFLRTEREYREIAERSLSLSETDRNRIRRIVDFVRTELQDAPRFRTVSQTQYRGDRDIRRNMDRWVETLIDAAIDIGKIVLSSQRRPTPLTYGQILSDLESIPHFAQLEGRLVHLAPLRNLMAHEYLDLRFGRVRDFATGGAAAIGTLADLAEVWIDTGVGGN